MILTPPLMAYLKLLVMENYGLFNFEGNTEEHDRFPKYFYNHLQTEIQVIGERKLVTFKGRVLLDAAWVVTPQFSQLWDDEAGLSAEVDEETKESLLARQAERLAAIRTMEETRATRIDEVPEGGFVRGITDAPRKKPDDNTMTYVVVGACLVAAIFFLNR